MTNERTQLAQVREARQLIERMRDRLIHPSFQALGECAGDLRSAAECIQGLDAQLPAWQGIQRKALEAEVTNLRRGVSCVQALLANAGKFYAGWARLLLPDQAPPNYTSAGSEGLAPGQNSKLVVHG